MTECPALTSRTEDANFLTADTFNELMISTFIRTPGTTVTLSCIDGLRLDGLSEITCRNDGTWSYGDNKPTCKMVVVSDTTDDSDDEEKILIGVIGGIAALIVLFLLIMTIVVCYTAKMVVSDTTDDSDDEEKILIGVIGGIAALIVLFLLIMMIVVCYKSKVSSARGRKFRHKDGLTKRDVAMYARQQSIYSQSNRGYPDADYRYPQGYDVTSRGYDYGTERGYYGQTPYAPWRTRQGYEDWSSQLGSNMYLPRDPRESRPPYAGENMYSRDWISRGSMYGTPDDVDYATLPSVHGRQGRDPYLWRNA